MLEHLQSRHLHASQGYIKLNFRTIREIFEMLVYRRKFYMFPIIILLVAMIGSIKLTLRDRGQVKRQKIFYQNNLDSKKTIEKKKVKLGEGINV